MYTRTTRKTVGVVITALIASISFGIAAVDAETTISGGGEKPLKIEFDDETGRPIRVEFDGATVANDNQFAFCDVLQGEKDSRDSKWLVNGRPTLIELKKTAPNAVVSVQRAGDWTLELQYFIDEKFPTLGFRTTIRWNGVNETKIKGFWNRFPLFNADEQSVAFAPGDFPPRKISAKTDGTVGERLGAWKRPAICALPNEKSVVSYVDFGDPFADGAETEIQAERGGFSATISWQIAARMKPGDAQTLGTSYLRFVDGDGETALKTVWDEYERIGETVPTDRPAEFSRAILYSFHPGGTIGSNCGDLGGFTAARRRMPDRLSELGVNSVWIMPVEDRGIYWPRDYYQFQAGLGTGDEYRALIESLHKAGLYVLQDIVPHGGSNEFDRAKRNPEQLVYDEDGNTFNYWCYDFNNPDWREYMASVARHYIAEYGIDGYRVDACGGSKDNNWNPNIPYERASFAKLRAGYNMLGAIRDAVKETNSINGGILAEVGDANLGAVSDAAYDFDWCYSVCPRLLNEEPAKWVADFRRWLFERKYGDPKGLLRLRHIESHDSLRSAGRYGVGAMRALMAAETFVDGIPLVYHEQEIGSVDDFRLIFSVRRALPELNVGEMNATSLNVPDGVFAIERIDGKNRSAVLVNLNSFPVDFSLDVSASITSETATVCEATEMKTGRIVSVENGAIPTKLAPYDWTVWALRRIDSVVPPAPIASNISSGAATTQAASQAATAPIRLSGAKWTAEIDRSTGLLRSLKFDEIETIRDAILELSDASTETAPVKIDINDGKNVVAVKSFGDAILRLEYRAGTNGLTVAYRWSGNNIPPDSELIFPTPNSDVWTARTAEGVLRDRLFFRNKNTDRKARHNIYYRELPIETLYDSFAQPLAKDGFAKAEGVDKTTAFRFDLSNENGETRPTRFRWINRAGTRETLAAALAITSSFVPDAAPSGSFQIEEPTPTAPLPNDPASAFSADVFDVATDAAQKNCRLTYELGGWRFENDFYRLRITRGGAIRSLVAKKTTDATDSTPARERELLKNGFLYTNYGFGDKDKLYTNRDDVEVYADFRIIGENKSRALRLRFSGRLRGGDRFALLPKPIEFAFEYRLDNSPNIGITASIDASELPADRSAFLALMIGAPEVDSFEMLKNGESLAAGKNLETDGRSAQTVSMQDFPEETAFFSGDRKLLTFRNQTGDRPANFFVDRSNVFVAFFDGTISDNTPKSRQIGWTISVEPR